MAMSIGAKGIDLEKVQVHPTGLVDPKDPDAKVKFLAAEALRGVGGLLIDATGNRFVDELQHRDYVTGKMWENNKFPVRLVLNSTSSKEIEWHCKHYVGRGLMKRFNSGEELAKEIGIKPDVLKKTCEAPFRNLPLAAKLMEYSRRPQQVREEPWVRPIRQEVLLRRRIQDGRCVPRRSDDSRPALHDGWSRDRYRLGGARLEQQAHPGLVCMW